MDTNLTEPQRQQLDGIVSKMVSNGESDDTIKSVVSDFKQKYAPPPQEHSQDSSVQNNPGFFSNLGTGIANVAKDIVGVEPNKSTSLIPSLIQSTIGSKGLAGIAQMPGRVATTIMSSNDQVDQQKQQQAEYDRGTQLRSLLKQETDPKKQQALKDAIKASDSVIKTYGDNISNLSDQQITPGQALGTTINSALTVGTGGTGSIAEKTGLTGAKALGARVAENSAIGAGFQVGSNLVDKKPVMDNVGTSALIGGALPIAGVGFSKAKGAILDKATPTAEMFINSLIKPLQKDFAYGKNPARGILNEGITANSFDDLVNQVEQKTKVVGEGIGTVGKQLDQSGVVLNLTPALKPVDDAIQAAAKANNNSLFNSLQNVKTALMHDMSAGVNDAGQPAIVKGAEKNLIGATYGDAKNFLSDISAHTKFTGNPSDDKALNMATKRAYGITRDIMNKSADSVDPALGTQIRNLNERYADLLSAKNAIAHRDIVEKRLNIMNLADRFGVQLSVVGAIGTGLVTGDWTKAGAVLMTELGSVAATKGLGSTAAKTRIAQFISRLAPEERQGILNSTPVLKNLYERLTGKTAPKIPETPTVVERKPVLRLNAGAIPLGPEAPKPLNKVGNNINQELIRQNNTLKLPAPSTIYHGPTQGGKPYTLNKAGFSTTPVVQTINKQGGFSKTGTALAGAGITGAAALTQIPGKKETYQATQNTKPIKQNNNIISGVDITKYATDPNHEKAVKQIHSNIPPVSSSTDISSYIKQKAPKSPVTGAMVARAANEFKVDAKLVMAIIQQDSMFGTKGLGARTRNPGNVGNTDSGKVTRYKSWEDGVRAVAKTLSTYKKNTKLD